MKMRKFVCILMALLVMTGSAAPVFAAEIDSAVPLEEAPAALTPIDADGEVGGDYIGSLFPEIPELDLKGVGTALKVTGSTLSFAGRHIYTYLINEEKDAPLLEFISSFAAGVEKSKLIEIQKTLADMTEQLTEIQHQISELRNQITNGFNALQDTVLQGQYTMMVNTYIKPVENDIYDSWAYYMFLCYQSVVIGANEMEDESEKAAALEEAAAMKAILEKEFTNWNTMESQWERWVIDEGGEKGAYVCALAQWEEDTKKIDFDDCLNKLSNLMISVAGEETLFSIREKCLRIQYPLEHQIYEGMNLTFQYVTSLQSRLLVLYRAYTAHLNGKDAVPYDTVEEFEEAQERIKKRTNSYLYDGETAINTVNAANETCGILNLQTPESIHQKMTLKNGETIDVYHVKSNYDGRYYRIAKDSPVLSSDKASFVEGVEDERGTYYRYRYLLTDAYKNSLASSDGRYQVINYDYAGRTLDGLLANCTTPDVLLYLRDACGLTEIDSDTNSLVTGKLYTERDATDGFGTTSIWMSWDYTYHLNARNFSHLTDGLKQCVEIGATHLVNNKGNLNGIPYNQLKYLPIFVDTHLYPADENTGSIVQLSQIPDGCCLVDGDVLDLSNAYDDAQNKSIYVNGNVKIIGGGANREIKHLSIHVAEGANLTIENLYLTGSYDEDGAICCDGAATLTLNGTNKISQGKSGHAIGSSKKQTIDGSISVVNGSNGKLILNSSTGKCVSVDTFNATDIILETSADGFEVQPNSGTLKNCTINSKNGKYDISKLKIENCTWTNYAPYKVVTQTGDLADSGTSNNLILTIDGVQVSTGEDLNKDEKQIQYVYGPALTSAPKKLKLKTSGSDAWYGVSVQVYSNLSNYGSPDGRWMVCQWVEEETAEIPNNNYGFKMKIRTANVSDAGTDANISAAFGYENSDGISWGSMQNLSDRIAGNAFEKNNNETVYIRQDYTADNVNAGEINWVAFKSDMANAAAGWKLYSAEITKMQAGKELETVTICPDQWIVDKNYTYTYPLTAKQGTSYQYAFTVKTSNKRNAGTDSNISYQLVGTKGTTNWVTSSSYIPGNAYEKNDTECFRLTFDKSVGIITGVNVKSDLKHAAAGWHLEYVDVYETNPVGTSPQQHNNGGRLNVNAWIEKGASEKHLTLSDNPAQEEVMETPVLSATSDPNSNSVELEVNPDAKWGNFTAIHIYRADTPNGDYTEVMKLTPDDGFKGMDPNLKQGERYYYKIALEKNDGTLVHFARIFCVKIGTGIVALPDTTVAAEGLDRDDITAALTAAGYDLEEIKEKLLNALKKLSGKSNVEIAFYDLQLYYKDGDQWLPADKEHFPEDGELYVSIPVPEGSDPETDTYYVAHMFSSDDFGKIAGKIETPDVTTHTDDQGQKYLDFSVTGLSPAVIGWTEAEQGDTSTGGEDDNNSSEENKNEDNKNENTAGKGEEESGATATGDTTNLTPWIIAAAASGAAVITAGSVLLIIKKRK